MPTTSARKWKAPAIPAGRFHLPHGMPDDYYAFTGGEISALVDKNGGINTLACIDIFDFQGKKYPDRHPMGIFRKEGNRCGKRSLYGPALQFLSTSRNRNGVPGRTLHHSLERMELHPFGFRNAARRFGRKLTYDLAIIGREVLFVLGNDDPERQELQLSISKHHICRGPANTLKNQLAEWGDHQERPVFTEARTWNQEWAVVGLNAGLPAWIMEGCMRLSTGDKGVVVAIAATGLIACTETEDHFCLTIPWNGRREIGVSLSVSGSRAEAQTRTSRPLAAIRRAMRDAFDASVRYSARATAFSAERFSDAAIFSATAPSFLQAMVLAENGDQACIRSATHKYGFFNYWDLAWTPKAFLQMGDWKTAVRLLRYPLDMLRGDEKRYEFIYLGLFEILVAEEAVSFTHDAGFEMACYADLKRLFLAYLGRAGEKGFLATGSSCGVDDPVELKIAGDIWPSCLNAQWYCACRAMENLALRRGDDDLAVRARTQAARIRENYLPTFYAPDAGYLYIAVDPATGRGIPIYMNVATLGMDFPYGEFLLAPRIREIAAYQADRLCHPAGRSAVAFDSPAHEMWKHVIMFQHLAHEMRTARAAGLGQEIERMMGVYLSHFRRNKVAMETLNLCGGPFDIIQRANWQAFGTRALYSGIIEGLIGIQCDLGGFGYAPCDTAGAMSISRFRFRRGTWEMHISGKGSGVKTMAIDGQLVVGTLKVPEPFLRDARRHRLEIMRGSGFRGPTLLAAPGAALESVIASRDRIEIRLANRAHASFKLQFPFQPTATLDNAAVPCAFDPTTGTAWIDAVFAPGALLQVSR